MKEKQFEPKILAFMCNWCAYGAADLAGVSRLQYPPNVRVVRVMCSATVSPHHILRTLQDGADHHAAAEDGGPGQAVGPAGARS